MPEGDSVLQLSNRMQWMGGRTLTRSDIRVPRFATEDLTGRTVTEVWPYGKHLFMDIGGRVLHTHLKMEGVWSIHTAGTRWRRPGHTARVVLGFAPQHAGGPEIEVVGHSLGFVRLFDRDRYGEVVAHLGPDILAPDWASTPPDGISGRDEALRRILDRPERSIGAALLDQRNVAGIGNEYRAEVCFLGGVDPRRPVGTGGRHDHRRAPARPLTSGDVGEPPGTAAPVHRRPTPRHGQLRLRTRGEGLPTRGSPIMKSFLGGVDADGDEGELERVIWWCPVCQAE
ncbi:DNA-(apurinic or apyrimidinic site) lyase OS=Corynebacterium variabile OX=1727 GN=CVA01_24500 PE=3 SV=1 [Corynebacterium variabile]